MRTWRQSLGAVAVTALVLAPACTRSGQAPFQSTHAESRSPPVIPGPSETQASLTAEAPVIASIRIGPKGQVPSVAYGAGSVWVAYHDRSPQQRGHLVRIDPVTNRIVHDLVVDTFPIWETGGGGLAIVDGAVWITGVIESSLCANPSSGRYQAALVRVDVAKDRPTRTVCLGGRSGADIAIDQWGVWVLIFGKQDRMEVVRVNPAAGTIVGRTDLRQHYGHQLLAVGHWIVAGVTHNPGENSLLAVIDPATGALKATVPVDSTAWLASDGRQLWAATGEGLERLNPETGKPVVGPFGVGTTGDALAVSEEAVSYLVPEGRHLVLMRLDPRTGGTTSIAVRGHFEWNALALAPGSLWGLGFNGTLYRVNLPG